MNTDKKQSIDSIMRAALHEVEELFGLRLEEIKVTWIDASSLRGKQSSVNELTVHHASIYSPPKDNA